MYHDLNHNLQRMMNHPVIRAISGDRHALGELPSQARDFNFDKTRPTEWHEVVDSDSSQEEAIFLSKLGVSFVMQGPPGTGKSQTITNIIAEALGEGKKVLFVSEKSAALQVVLKRLTEARLDDFCLSLHNYKANKKAHKITGDKYFAMIYKRGLGVYKTEWVVKGFTLSENSNIFASSITESMDEIKNKVLKN